MSILTIENHINVALLSFTIAPSTFLAFAVLLFAYLYILHIRNNPKPRIIEQYRPEIQAAIPYGVEDHRGNGRHIRRPSLYTRLSGRLRTYKQRDRPEPAVRQATSPLAAFWLPFRNGFRDGGVRRQIQSAGVVQRRSRESKTQSRQRLLE